LIVSQKVECSTCGRIGKSKTKGSFIITIVLLFFGIFPGLIYEIWRRSGGKVCSSCGSQNIHLHIPNSRQTNSSLKNDHVMSITENNVEQKNCNFCKELIRIDAIKCKHCGSMLT